ncbi:DUF389 domain-containing protein [Flavobacterium aquatile]|uniref:DUF389 domain-containing protein n=1 Tax=Flavobacterium aquatile TaxID=245 RepID=UPI00068C2A06|nr:DUF389 domain-containing protein [Flavobacterium aquatile]OXA67912.1 hypothetical protein B0A61_05435 [Flavobacterium aquatile LMG 4008 = ATCC 11947]GEC78678.1 membrane protein [Flavobacterium aquatile]
MTSNLAVIKRYFKTVLNLKTDQEAEQITYDEIKSGVIFKGTNFWIMAFAIFIACIGLNINSKAAVIGAMIISPLMGPIFGIGFSLGTSNSNLLKLSLRNVFRIVVISILCSTLYYLLSPYHIATDELLSFSKPTIFDIFLAFIGGMAGMIAISRHDGNRVLVGIAVATACIPPLCTAGYGIATLQWEYILGGLYTYFINALFICLGCYIITRYLKFARFSESNIKHINSYFGVLAFIAILPALYLAYNLWMVNVYNDKIKYFVANEIEKTHHVTHTTIDVETKTLTIDVIVNEYEDNLAKSIEDKLVKHDLNDTKVKVFQTIKAINNRSEIQVLQKQLDELKAQLDKLK